MVRKSLLLTAALAATAACGAEEPETLDEYAAAIPSSEMLALEASEAGSVQQGLGPNPATLIGQARDVATKLDELRDGTHASIEALIAGVEPVEISRGQTTCKVWERDADAVHWQLVSCLNDRRTDRYAFVLQGRPVASTSDMDYRAVFAGLGRALPSHEEQRRGAGIVGYNFDHLAELTGAQVTGALGLGYRVAGRGKQIVLGLANVAGPEDVAAHNAIFHYVQVDGRGGRFSFNALADFLTRDGSGNVIEGQDQVAEFGRTVLGWRADGAARTAALACGGTLGEGTCVHVSQCWTANSELTYSSIGESATWDEASCAELALGLGELDEGSEAPAGGDSTGGAPIMGEPGPIDGE